MGLRYNPFTGSFDMTRSPGSYLDGEVAAYTDLPLGTAAAPLNSAWLVRAGSGLWLLTRKPAGIYIRTATGGTDRDADYSYAGTFPDVFSDANFVVYNNSDSTKNVKLSASALTTGTTRTLTVPDASGTIATTAQAADMEITDNTKGVILKSANNTRYRLTVTNSGLPVFTALLLLLLVQLAPAQTIGMGTATNGVVLTDRTNTLTFTNALIAGSTLTATGNVTMSGVDNTAPSQAASSGASLMTRDLIYQSQMDFNSGDMIGIQSTLVSGTGAGSAQFNTFGWQVSVTTNTNTAAGAYFGDMLWSQSSFSGALMPANKAVDCTLKGVMLRVETNTNFVNRIVFGTGVPNRTPPAAGNPAATNQGWGVNFFYNGTNQVAQPFWYTTNYNTAANIILTNLSDASWTARVFTMRFQQTTNGQISFYINNGLAVRLSSTPTWTTNVTWPSVNYGGRFIAMECAAATNAAPASGARMHFRNAYIKYDP